MNKIERRFGKFSLTNLTLILIVGRIFCFVLQYVNPEFLAKLALDPIAIMDGEVWRLITFIFVSGKDPLWFIFSVLFLYWVGNGLESVWGSFKYTMYILSYILGVGAAVVLGYFFSLYSFDIVYVAYAYSIPTLFTYTLFLPFAWYYGEEVMSVFFFFPIKVKYLAVVDLLLILGEIINIISLPPLLLIFAFSMINTIVFFIVVLVKRGKQRGKLANFRHKIAKAEHSYKNAIHKCHVCGITEKDNPDMSFRYCSKCEGEYEFCEEHLRTHEHVSKVVKFEDIRR